MGAQEHGDLLVPKLWDSRCAGTLGTCSVPSSTRPRFAFAPIQHCKQHRPAPQGSPPCGGGTGTPGGSCAPQRARAHPTHSRGRSAAALRPLSQPACCRSRSRPRKPQAKSRSSLPCAGAFPAGLTGISAPSRSSHGDGTGPRLRSLGKPLTASTTRALPAAIGGLLRVHSPGAGESFGETKGWFLPKKKKNKGQGSPVDVLHVLRVPSWPPLREHRARAAVAALTGMDTPAAPGTRWLPGLGLLLGC